MGEWKYGSIFLDLSTSWGMVSIKHWPLCPQGKSPPYSLDLDRTQNRSERCIKEKILDFTGTRTPIHLSSSP
jgi:hypothetical protein